MRDRILCEIAEDFKDERLNRTPDCPARSLLHYHRFLELYVREVVLADLLVFVEVVVGEGGVVAAAQDEVLLV